MNEWEKFGKIHLKTLSSAETQKTPVKQEQIGLIIQSTTQKVPFTGIFFLYSLIYFNLLLYISLIFLFNLSVNSFVNLSSNFSSVFDFVSALENDAESRITKSLS